MKLHYFYLLVLLSCFARSDAQWGSFFENRRHRDDRDKWASDRDRYESTDYGHDSSRDKVLLSNVQSLTFADGEMTSGRRHRGVPQVRVRLLAALVTRVSSCRLLCRLNAHQEMHAGRNLHRLSCNAAIRASMTAASRNGYGTRLRYLTITFAVLHSNAGLQG
jgi:hypothetical protein